ncbi:sodium:calcium antiporter [Crocinitomicaceae bacterium]|nr:sodium:calcium antiporter [Crocinitomicaceae bacterium]
MTIVISLALILLCCLIIWKASDGFETASEYIGRNLSEGVRGATINAIGSSMPELFTTLFFLFILKDKDGFAGGIGTTAGSAIFNGMIIPAVVILVVIFKRISSSVEVSRKVLIRDGLSLLICELVLIFLIGGDNLNWIHGLVLMLLYAIYVIYMLSSMKANKSDDGEEDDDDEDGDEDEDEAEDKGFILNALTLNLEPMFIKNEINAKNAWWLLIVSMTIIGGACMLLVKSCEWLGDAMGVPIYFIAVVLASAATSVPDTILSMKDAKKGNYDDAVSNALGSNIFDVCFALGFPLFLFSIINGPIEMSASTVENISELRILLFILTLLAFIIYLANRKMGKTSAFLLLGIYVLFTVFILGKSMDAEFSSNISAYLSQINHWVDSLRFWL